MCILIDTNRASAFNKPSPAMCAILDWIAAGGRVVAGGKLTQELESTRLASFLSELGRQGRLITYREDQVEAEIKEVKKLNIRSDDAHVLAIARLSKASILITNDNKLIADFKDKDICEGKRRAIRKRPDKPDMPAAAVQALLVQAKCT